MLFLLLAISAQLLAAAPNLVVVRHGEGEHNIQKVFSILTKEEGGVDHRLTDKGQLEVRKTAERLLEQGFNCNSVSLVLVSPLQRTRETARILVDCGVCSEESLIIDPRIREFKGIKEWDGKAMHTVVACHRMLSSWLEQIEVCAKAGGETSEELLNRIESALAYVKELKTEGHVIFVTHGMIASAILDLYGENTNVQTAEAKILPLN